MYELELRQGAADWRWRCADLLELLHHVLDLVRQIIEALAGIVRVLQERRVRLCSLLLLLLLLWLLCLGL
jgi:hypothetical protein